MKKKNPNPKIQERSRALIQDQSKHTNETCLPGSGKHKIYSTKHLKQVIVIMIKKHIEVDLQKINQHKIKQISTKSIAPQAVSVGILRTLIQ